MREVKTGRGVSYIAVKSAWCSKGVRKVSGLRGSWIVDRVMVGRRWIERSGRDSWVKGNRHHIAIETSF